MGLLAEKNDMKVPIGRLLVCYEQQMAATTNPQTIMKYAILIGLLLTLPVSVSHAQKIEHDVALPDSVMKQAVQQILRRHVKPPSQPQIVYILDRLIRVECLPRIKNIEFRIVKEDWDYASRQKKGYVFDRLRKEKGRFLLDLGYGDLDCGETKGDSWAFSVRKNRVRFLKVVWFGWGMRCHASA